jgi:hypothetical protein
MMTLKINKNMNTYFLFHKMNKSKTDEPKENHDRDWFVIIFLAFCLGVVLVPIDVYTYIGVDSRLNVVTAPASTVAPYASSQKKLNLVSDQIKALKTENQALEQGYKGVNDPSY